MQFGFGDLRQYTCKRCDVEGCNLIDFLAKTHKLLLGMVCDYREKDKRCQKCTDANKKVMDYRKSKWVKQGETGFGVVLCEDKDKIIDGFYSVDDKDSFQGCIDKP